MALKTNNILKYNQGDKSITMSFIISADTEQILQKISSCEKISEKSLATNSSATRHHHLDIPCLQNVHLKAIKT